MYVSRAGEKLAFALNHWHIDIAGLVCADLGASTGGFTDCLLQHGATKVYAVDTGYGVLAYKLRTDPRVVVFERANALHVKLPESVDLVTIDVGWTPQALILPHALALLKQGGNIISLLKPHYEAKKPRLKPDESQTVLCQILSKIPIKSWVESPLTGAKARNIEYLLQIQKN